MQKTTLSKLKLHARLVHFPSGRPGVVFETWSGVRHSPILSASSVHKRLLDNNEREFQAHLNCSVAVLCGLPPEARVEVDAGHVEFVLNTLSRDDAAWMLANDEKVSCKLKDAPYPPSVWATAGTALVGTFMISFAVFGAARLTGGLERTR